MRRRLWIPIVTAASLLLPVAAAQAQAPAAGAEPADARAWLARIHAAAQQRNYQGTMVVSAAGGMLSSSRVAHFSVGEQTFERLEALDGRQQRVYRVGDAVHTVWPQQRIVVVEKRTPISRLPSSRAAVEPRALEQYELLREGVERVAGRDAQVFLLRPRDELRYAQRLWADKATGLMLRADVIGPQRAVLESAAFSEVEVGVRPQADSVTQPMKKFDGYRVVRPEQQHTQLDAEGWTLEKPVPGFQLSGCVKRPLETVAADGPASADAQVLQAVFSDGLTHVSVFIEPNAPRRAKFTDLSAQIGATATLRQRRDQHWITVMGDVPAATLKAFADALQRRR
ncbi:MucB/RseB C-terminal domain-containing protein [Rubrivivax sp. RP6-9]|uniref:MucB/RseB C-terminal domain-containing protein n=1 Tax=Rubrivivax sp. RP6-9 TaxID=3415750 RepID=UPI003CC5B318